MDMQRFPTSAEINGLFTNSEPDAVWGKANGIIRRINPDYDSSLARTVFDDVMRIFRGDYFGYCPIKTLYHDLPHTLDVFLCAVRLMHGVHVSGDRLSDDDITLVIIAALMHDVGYAQLHNEETGTGAQFTQDHVRRGIEFMRSYLAERNCPSAFAAHLEPIILCTELAQPFQQINFPDGRARLLGQIVGTADLVGQMADRTYLEKLLFLYQEFEEANIGDYRGIHDLLHKTTKFYEFIQKKLDGDFEGLYAKLTWHFKDTLGIEANYYLESIEKNIAYLMKILALDEAECLSMLKRGGIVEKNRFLVAPAQ